MNVYVWEDVLRDYTAGMVVVIAKSEEEAWEVLRRTQAWVMSDLWGDDARGFPANSPVEFTQEKIEETGGRAWCISGGA